jgi:hypothetical protein
MVTHHILVNNAIIVGKRLELNAQVVYVCISYADKKPVEESDSPLSLERTQTRISIIILAHNDNYRAYETKKDR